MKHLTSYKSAEEFKDEVKRGQVERRAATKTGTWIFQEKEEYIFKYFSKLDRKLSIVDLGSFTGYFLNKLADEGFTNLSGVDLADLATDNKKYKLHLADINKERLPFPNESVDIVTAFQVMEHVDNYFHPMREVHRILKKDGLFIFSVPNQFNIFSRFRFALTGNMTSWNIRNNHMLFLTRDVFKKTFLNKFDLIDVYYDKGTIPFWGRLNMLPGVWVGNKKKLLPRSEMFGYNACYFLKKL